MSREYHILDHHHDSGGGVYRMLVGVPEEIQRPKTDDDGNIVYTPIKLQDEHGNPQLDVNGNEIVMPGPPELETVVEHRTVYDYVFASDDERWEGKTPEQIAKMQRDEIKKALADQDREAAKAAKSRKRKQLPGSGEKL